MPEPVRIVGLSGGKAYVAEREVHFTLLAEDGTEIQCRTQYDAIAQLIAGLSQLAGAIRARLDEEKAILPVTAETVARAEVEKDLWADEMLLELLTDTGIPYRFRVPSEIASRLSARLESEISKPQPPPGRA